MIKRLTDEHTVIHDAIEAALDFFTDTLLSHFAYEEQDLVEPLARLGS